MKQIFQYKCEVCGSVYDTREKCLLCEAECYGLTVEEYTRWGELCANTKSMGHLVSVSKNQATDKAFDDACDKLADFILKHNLQDRPTPSQFL